MIRKKIISYITILKKRKSQTYKIKLETIVIMRKIYCFLQFKEENLLIFLSFLTENFFYKSFLIIAYILNNKI